MRLMSFYSAIIREKKQGAWGKIYGGKKAGAAFFFAGKKIYTQSIGVFGAIVYNEGIMQD